MKIDEKTIENCKNILSENYKANPENKILIFYDNNSKLNRLLSSGYEESAKILNIACESVDFYSLDEEEIKKKVDGLEKNDIVVLIQTSSFRMTKYRWRNILFQKGLKVIEHPHLEKNAEEEIEIYIDSLNFDLPHYMKTSSFLKKKLSESKNLKLISENGDILEFSEGFEEVYDNMGYFEDKNNWGARFPIGEVFTELLDLKKLNGTFMAYAYPDLNHKTKIAKPFKCIVKDGFLIDHEGPKEFDELIEMIKEENPEKKVFIRELGLGMNRNIKREKPLSDISSFERIEGVHMSLGMKHGIYEKKLWKEYGKKFYQRYHIDIFLDVERIINNDSEILYIKKTGYQIE